MSLPPHKHKQPETNRSNNIVWWAVLAVVLIASCSAAARTHLRSQAVLHHHQKHTLRGPGQHTNSTQHASTQQAQASSIKISRAQLGLAKQHPSPAQQQQQQQQQRNPEVALLLLAAVSGWNASTPYDEPRGNGSRQHLYWLSVANRRAYAQQHGYPFYVLSHHLESGRWPTWDKLLAASAVLQHSQAEWVWMTDADTFVMNQSLPVTQVIHSALRDSMQAQGLPAGRLPDVIAATTCFSPLNSGSLIFRNTDWTRQHLADVWHAEQNCNGYTDNGAFLELFKQPEVRSHYWQVPQRQLNAYPAVSKAELECKNGSFQEGDLLVHFPGDFKQVLPAFIQQHEQLRRLSDYGLTAGTCQLRQPAGVGCSKLPAVQQLYGNNSGSIGSGSASVERSDAVNASSRVVKAVGAADSKPPGVSEAPSGSRGSVPVFAVLNLGQRAGTAAPVQQQQQQQRQISLVHVDLVSNQQQGITTLLRSASLTLSIVQQQQQQALEEPQQQQQTGFVPQHNSVLYNPGWPVTLPPEPPTGQPNGSLALPHVLVTDIDGRL